MKVIYVKDGKDPADLCFKDPQLWIKAVEEAEPIYDYYLRSTSMRYNSKEADGKRRIAAELVPVWSKISDSLTREHYLQKLSALLGVEEVVLRREIQKYGKLQGTIHKTILEKNSSGPNINPMSRRELLEEYLLALLLKMPLELIYVPNFPESIFLSENLRTVYVLLVLYLDAISFRARSFSITDFVKSVPEDLVVTIDRLYLVEIDEKLTSPKTWQHEVSTAVAELKKALLKASLEKLSTEIKNAQAFGKMELLTTLNKRFRDLSVRLKNL